MANAKLEFTGKSIKAITPPSIGRAYFRDLHSRSLILDVLPNGTKTFQVYRKVNGKPVRIALGKFNPELPDTRDFPLGTDPLTVIGNAPELNVRMARKLADAVNASLDKGSNPAQSARETRIRVAQELTLRQAFDRYYADHLLPHGKRTADDLRNDFARYLGTVAPGQKKIRGKEKAKSAGSVDWEVRKLSSISQQDVRTMMISLKDQVGARTANKAFVLLRSIYNSTIMWKLYRGENPCTGIEKFRENSRERFVTGEELPRFMAALDKVAHQDFKNFVQLSLFTGARRANVLAMRWQDLDFNAGIWTIPGEVSKNGTTLTIPLPRPAQMVLNRRKASREEGALYVFPAHSETGHMSPPNKRWKALLADAGIADLRLHDLRRSLGSWAAISGASLPVIGKMLGHKSSQATAVYARLHLDPVAEAMEMAISAMHNKTNAPAELPMAPGKALP